MVDGERRGGGWVTAIVVVSALLLLVAIHRAVLRVTIDVTRLSESRTVDDRDLVYLILHSALLLGAIAVGFAIGAWRTRAGLGLAMLFACVLAVTMVVVQAGSEVLACEMDRNDLVRHWQCEVTRTD